MRFNLDRQALALVCAGAFAAALGIWGSSFAIHATSGSEFCMICHEMEVVGIHGWLHSAHVKNDRGVVAECGDCHIPPGLVPMLWTKARDGSKDIWVHLFGESDPGEMEWMELRETARAKIRDSACERCHSEPVPRGASIKMIVAHRANLRLDTPKKCLDCHREQFHGRFLHHLPGGREERVDGRGMTR